MPSTSQCLLTVLFFQCTSKCDYLSLSGHLRHSLVSPAALDILSHLHRHVSRSPPSQPPPSCCFSWTPKPIPASGPLHILGTLSGEFLALRNILLVVLSLCWSLCSVITLSESLPDPLPRPSQVSPYSQVPKLFLTALLTIWISFAYTG